MSRFGEWVRRNSPSRDELMASRWLRPFAHRIAHSELWRFTRRSALVSWSLLAMVRVGVS